MGIQSIQDFIDSSDSFTVPLTTYFEGRTEKASNLLVVHVDSCIRQLYHEHIDWICGGQWNELLQSVNKFVRAFRQLGIELIVFFDGSLNKASLHNWSTKHRFYQDIVRETLSHIVNNQNIPFRTKVKNFVAPGALKSALRLAFRSFDVLVCTSLEDVYKEALLLGKDMRCIGTVGNDANLFLINTSSYINIGQHIKLLKKVISSCKVYVSDLILKELNLDAHLLPYLAALLGNFMVNDAELSSFYWQLVDEDHPLKKIQASMILEAVLPPSEVRLRCVAKFLAEKQDQVDDIDALAAIVFGKATNITVSEGKRKLKIVIDYYKDILHALGSAPVRYDDEKEMGVTAGGFPLPSLSPRYKSVWEYSEKAAQLPIPPTPPKSDLKEVDIVADDADEGKLSNPEDVIKQGTLEEAAQALIQLELNEETENEEKVVVENGEEKVDDKEVLNGVVHDDEKKPKKTVNHAILHPDEEGEGYAYSREIHVESVVDTLDKEVLKTARQRHQNGQMCPEVLNLLLKKEIVLDLAIDEEVCEERLPIPLIFRPIRQLVYGILFEVETTVDQVEEQPKEPLLNGIVSEEKRSDSEVEEVKGPNDEAVVNGSNPSDPEDGKEVSENGEEKTDVIESTQLDGVECSKDLIKEWCIYSGRTSEEPDLVQPMGMNWDVPPLTKLWFGMSSDDDSTRLKAFLSCMKSDTANMSNTAMVPQRLMILCCVLRYLIQQEKTILTKHDIDAFLAQALSTQLTLEHVNSQNLANIKLTQIDARCVKLAAIFMSGVENAIVANDACGSPVPWEFCCPWNFFDGKLFHLKWVQSSSMNTKELCEGKEHVSEKLERLRWCIAEGLEVKITGLNLGPFSRTTNSTKSNNSKNNNCNNNNYNNTNNTTSGSANSNSLRHAVRGGGVGVGGQPQMRARSRGAGSKRAVHGSGGTLHVAGVPVAHWHGNKSGVGYSKHAPGVLVGGPNSVDLPSNHPTDHRRGRGRGGMGRAANRGRGLLQTPFISPWQQGFGLEEYVNNTYQRYMKGVKQEQLRNKQNKVNNRYQVFSSRTRNQPNQGPNNKPQQPNINNNWFGKGRGKLQHSSPEKTTLTNVEQPYGRGQWINTGS